MKFKDEAVVFFKWIGSHFHKEYILTPLAKRNVLLFSEDWDSCDGYSDWYVFGVRVVRIQTTFD